jgi:uncharacterized membrane protein YvbJ
MTFCPACSRENHESNVLCNQCGANLPTSTPMSYSLPPATRSNYYVAPYGSRAYTIKPATVIFFILGIIVPFWLITLPLFWFLAYQSYKKG